MELFEQLSARQTVAQAQRDAKEKAKEEKYARRGETRLANALMRTRVHDSSQFYACNHVQTACSVCSSCSALCIVTPTTARMFCSGILLF